MDLEHALQLRKLGLSNKLSIDFALDRFHLRKCVKLEAPPGPNGPLTCTRFPNHMLAIANEDGTINLLQTQRLERITNWVAHDNAIFDIKTSLDERSLITASGDATIRQWDIEAKRETFKLTPHHSSVKSISIYDANTLASGSRDGTIQVHDIRQKNATFLIIRDAHRNYSIRKPRKTSAKTDPVSCVTNVVFDPHFPRIYSTGANDATIKLWDLRRPLTTPRRMRDGTFLINQPNKEVHHPSKGMHCGYSHLLLSSGKIYAACSDNKIYCYENFGSQGLTSEPIIFTGYRYDTYLKMAIMDGRILFSGAKGGGAIMWSSRNPTKPRHLKPDDNDECDTNAIEVGSDCLFTLREDHLVCKWSYALLN